MKESRTTWIPINTQYREEKVFMTQITYTELQDRRWQWGAVTKEEHEDLFKIIQTNSRPYEFDDNVHISVSYELYLNLTVIDRQAYSILDLLGDVGGLGEALVYIFTFMLAFVNYGKFNTMLSRFLYMASIKDESSSGDDGSNDH